MPSHIIAMGGGGFSMEPDNPALDRYVLSVAQTRRAYPRVCFLPSATDNIDGYLLKFYQAFGQFDCAPTHLSLFSPPTADLRGLVPRWREIRYSGFDQSGVPFVREVTGFHARVVQHECDHLDGILYPRRIRDLTQFGYTDVLFPGQDLVDD